MRNYGGSAALSLRQVVTPCRSEGTRKFRGTYHNHFQGRTENQATEQQKQVANTDNLISSFHDICYQFIPEVFLN
jgi:hypothetical protein